MTVDRSLLSVAKIQHLLTTVMFKSIRTSHVTLKMALIQLTNDRKYKTLHIFKRAQFAATCAPLTDTDPLALNRRFVKVGVRKAHKEEEPEEDANKTTQCQTEGDVEAEGPRRGDTWAR